MKTLDPKYIIPTHCTGRKAVMNIEKEMPDKFLLNMSGTKMVFAGIKKEEQIVDLIAYLQENTKAPE